MMKGESVLSPTESAGSVVAWNQSVAGFYTTTSMLTTDKNVPNWIQGHRIHKLGNEKKEDEADTDHDYKFNFKGWKRMDGRIL